MNFLERVAKVEYDIYMSPNENYISNHFILEIYPTVFKVLTNMLIELEEFDEKIIHIISNCLYAFVEAEPQKLMQDITDFFSININAENKNKQFAAIVVISCSLKHCSFDLPKTNFIQILNCADSEYIGLKKVSLRLLGDLIQQFPSIIDDSDINSIFSIFQNNIDKTNLSFKEALYFMQKLIESQNAMNIFEQIISIIYNTDNYEAYNLFIYIIKSVHIPLTKTKEILMFIFEKLNNCSEINEINELIEIIINILNIREFEYLDLIPKIIQFLSQITNIDKLKNNTSNEMPSFYLNESIILMMIQISPTLFEEGKEFIENFLSCLFQGFEIISHNTKLLFLLSLLLGNICFYSPALMEPFIKQLLNWFSYSLSKSEIVFYDPITLLNIFSDIIEGFQEKSQELFNIFIVCIKKIFDYLMESDIWDVSKERCSMLTESMLHLFSIITTYYSLDLNEMFLIQNDIFSLIKKIDLFNLQNNTISTYSIIIIYNLYKIMKQKIVFSSQNKTIKNMFETYLKTNPNSEIYQIADDLYTKLYSKI